MPKIAFTKSPLSHQKSIDLMISRGLPLVSNEDLKIVRKALSSIGYFRLSGYMLPFQHGGASPLRHNFKPGTTIQKIMRLYKFDSCLRTHILEALEIIEVSFRSTISDHLSLNHGSHWHTKNHIFSANHYSVLEKIAEACGFDLNTNRPNKYATDQYLFIEQYYKKYNNPAMPPGWMISECLSFRNWAFIYQNLLPQDQKGICNSWLYPDGKRIDHTIIENWLHSLAVLRNRCAHHARITGRTFPFPPKAPSANIIGNSFDANTTDLRSLLLVIAILLKNADPQSMWLKQLYNTFNIYTDIDFKAALRFPLQGCATWEDDPLWKL